MTESEAITALTIHASCVAIGGRAVLIRGPSGAGKSDLSLRLIDRGAVLVSDDYTALVREGDALLASAPPTIAGRIEVRGFGIVAMPHVARAPVALVVQLAPDTDRMPDRSHERIAGVSIPAVTLEPFAASAAFKVELALRELSA